MYIKKDNKPKIALIYHLNLNHFSLSYSQREMYLSEILPQIGSIFKIPINFSACSEDLLIIKHAAPKAFKQLTNSSHIAFLPSTFSHCLPIHFPEDYFEQISLGFNILQKIVPSSKILPFGYPPEVDCPPKIFLDNLSKYWPGIIIGESRSKWILKEPRKDLFCSEGIVVAISRRYMGYRDILHRYFRELATTEDVLQALNSDYKKFGNEQLLIARIDLETIIFNGIKLNGKIIPHRLDLLVKLQQHFANSDFEFIHLDKEIFSCAKKRFLPMFPLEDNHEEDYKWVNPSLLRTISELRPLDNYHRVIYLSSMCSDYFCLDLPKIELNAKYNGEMGKIQIIRSRTLRQPELDLKLAALKTQQPISAIVPIHQLKSYVQLMEKSYRVTSKIGFSRKTYSPHLNEAKNKQEEYYVI